MSGKKIILVGFILAAGYLAYKLAVLSQLNLQFTGVKFSPFPPRASLNFAFQNNSLAPINIQEITGNLIYQGQAIAVVFNQQSVRVPASGTGQLSLNVRPNISAVISDIVSLGSGLITHSANIYFQGTVQTDVGTFPFTKYVGA